LFSLIKLSELSAIIPRWRGFVIRGVRKKLMNVQIVVADFAI
jgi:hypothetical protein